MSESAPTIDLRPDRATSTVSVLREDERRRDRYYAGAELITVCIMLAVIPFLGGDDRLRTWLLATGLLSLPGLAAMQLAPAWASKSMSRLILCKALMPLMVLVAMLYFGVLSPALIAIAAGAFYYSQSTTRWMRDVFIVLMAVFIGGYLVLVSLGVVTDRSLFGIDARPLGPQLAMAAGVLSGLYAIRSFADASRRSTLQAVEALEQALLDVARKKALLAEANQDLDRARGGRGQFYGRRAGGWLLGRVLGRGGMGEVYEASAEGGAAAAVKLLLLDPAEDQAVLARFRREAEVLRRLACPHVVKLFDVGEIEAGPPYLAMELLAGHDLAALLRKQGALPIAEVGRLVSEVAVALEAARQADIVHRDLKPSNLFFDEPAHRWKVLDFGVSKLGAGGTLTADHVLGTPGYMAPEQASGEPVDHRADVFSLAAIAYRSLTGRPAFTADDAVGLMVEVLRRQPPDPSTLAELPADVGLALALGLAKRPADRCATAAELAGCLDDAAGGHLSAAHRERARALLRRHGWGQLAAA